MNLVMIMSFLLQMQIITHASIRGVITGFMFQNLNIFLHYHNSPESNSTFNTETFMLDYYNSVSMKLLS